MNRFTFDARHEDDTVALGAAVADALPDHAVVALNGTLGAGKTRLVQALAAALGVDPRDVVSPTFVLVQEYRGRRPIFHFDAYRVQDENEFWELGAGDYFSQPGVSLVEWAERVPGCMPSERLEISIEVTAPTSRRFVITAFGTQYHAVIDRLTAWAQKRTDLSGIRA
jgi:tRNA threonylcarbamoyladenosine biosynthesis protein TsaE